VEFIRPLDAAPYRGLGDVGDDPYPGFGAHFRGLRTPGYKGYAPGGGLVTALF